MNGKAFKLLPIQILLPLFVTALQIQWPILFQGSKVLLNLSDIFLPFILSYFLILALRTNFLSYLKALYLPFWFVVFTLWFGSSILFKYYHANIFLTKVFFDNFLGWLVLIPYFFLGNFIARTDEVLQRQHLDKGHAQSQIIILKTLFISTVLVSFIHLIAIFLNETHGPKPTGFFIDSNAFGLFLSFVILLQIPCLLSKAIFPTWIQWAMLLCNSMVLLLTDSRAALIALFTGLINFVVYNALRRKWRYVLLLGVLIPLGILDYRHHSYFYTKILEISHLEYTEEQRMNTTIAALKWWQERKVTGIGLGGFLSKQEEQHITPTMIIHNTPLWFLTETGLIGVFLYGGFLMISRNRVALLTKSNPKNEKFFTEGMLMIFPAFMVASVVTEIFYQRYLWFFLGLVLAKKETEISLWDKFLIFLKQQRSEHRAAGI